MIRRRRLRSRLFVLLLIAAVFLVGGLPFAIAGKDAQRPSFTHDPRSLTLPAGASLDSLQVAHIEDVIDGDTISARLPDGRYVAIRYFGIDTPEKGEPCYRDALQRNIELAGKKVLLLPDVRETDRFGRLLRYIFTPDGVSIDATLVAEGFAHAWREDGAYRDQIIALEDGARAEGRGCLWRGQ